MTKTTYLCRFAVKSMLAAVFVVCPGTILTAQEQEEVQAPKNVYVYNQKQQPLGFGNYMMATYYYNGKKAYNLRGYVASNTSGAVEFLEVNPSGTSYALLTQKGEETKVSIYDLWKAERELGNIKKVTCLSYSIHS